MRDLGLICERSANYGSLLAFELRDNDEGEAFLRVKFKNGTEEPFRILHLFGHKEDIALNEFLYRLDVSSKLDFSTVRYNSLLIFHSLLLSMTSHSGAESADNRRKEDAPCVRGK